MVYRDPKELIPYEDNPRVNDHVVPFLDNSIDKFDFLVPVVIDRNDRLITGHTRIKAAIELGMDAVPTVCAEHLTPDEADEFRLVDNKMSEMSYWDRDLQRKEMERLDFDWENYGFEPLAMPEDIPVWEGPSEEVEEIGGGDESCAGTYTARDERCRLLVVLPDSAEPSAIMEMLESEGCTVKILD